jgi:hypothetical protein
MNATTSIETVPIADRRRSPIKSIAVIPDCLGRTTADATLDGFDFLWSGRLFEDVRNADTIVASDILGSVLATKVAIRALAIDVIFSWDVQWISVVEGCHRRYFA